MSTMKCPFCAEEIQEGAAICKHCKSIINSSSDRKILNKKSYKNYLIGFVVFMVILIFLAGILGSVQLDKATKRASDIAYKIKTTADYIVGKNSIKVMVVYNHTGKEFINPTGADNTYSESSFNGDQYFVSSGIKVNIYEEDSVHKKSLIKTIDNDKEIIGWIDNNSLITQDEYNALKKKEEDAAAKVAKEQEAVENEWRRTNPKAWQICSKNSEWSNFICEKLANKEYWIGMDLDMLKAERGDPNSSNPSNYGGGTKWQWCWDDYTPMCFYGGSDGIITSYN